MGRAAGRSDIVFAQNLLFNPDVCWVLAFPGLDQGHDHGHAGLERSEVEVRVVQVQEPDGHLELPPGQVPQRVALAEHVGLGAGDHVGGEELRLQRLVVLEPSSLEGLRCDAAEVEASPPSDDNGGAGAHPVEPAQATGGDLEPVGVMAQGLLGVDRDSVARADGVVRGVRSGRCGSPQRRLLQLRKREKMEEVADLEVRGPQRRKREKKEEVADPEVRGPRHRKKREKKKEVADPEV